MRKARLAIDPEAENISGRKQKLMERKRRKEMKGKTVIEVEPSKDVEQEVVADVEAVGRKRAGTEDVPLPSQDVYEDEKVQLSFPLEGSFISDPKDLLAKSRKYLLPKDDKRLLSLGHRKPSERTLHQAIQMLQGTIFMERELVSLSRKNKEVATAYVILKKDFEGCKNDNDELVKSKETLERRLNKLEIEKAAELEVARAKNDCLRADMSRLQKRLVKLADDKENCELTASTAMTYKFMKEFTEHRGE